MKKLDLEFEIVITEDLQYTVECDARDIETDEIVTYVRKTEKSPREHMNSIVNQLKRQGHEIYNITFSALNIG